ncbi:hypothetical protein BCR44DRAFT_1540960 [Catenaria anguillulae PL171]|uniref:Uncharacterized protein n=1 Tax=Catenaria anguillulae PL171 TaxID=765915 RepID=A0A1Y2HWD9_9FUNG|nr:hypothetical protein BCR44DRAFT_1540960 [Catenaria anguillulae PL171]
MPEWMPLREMYRRKAISYTPAAKARSGRETACSQARFTKMPTDTEPHPIIPIQLTHLLAALDYAQSTSKTPIILDKSGKVDVFFAHRHSVIVECKPLVLDVFMRHTLTAADGARVLADKIRGAMQVAAYLHFRLTDSAPNFKKLADATLNESIGEIMHHAAWFPYADVFDVKAVRDDALVAKLDPLNHPGVVRKPNDAPLVVREGFSVVVTSKFDPEDAVEFLTSSLPLSKCQFFHIADPNA